MLAVLFTLVTAVLVTLGEGPVIEALRRMFLFGIFINLVLAFFNLIPIPPLDGSHVLYHLLPPRAAEGYRRAGRWGFLVIILLVFAMPGVLQLLLTPVNLLMGAADWFIRLWI